MKDNMPEELKELERLSKPLIEYLREKYDPHATIVIKDDFVRVVRDELGVPFPIPEDY